VTLTDLGYTARTVISKMIYAVCVLRVFFIALPEITFAQASPADSAPPKQQAGQAEKWPPNKRGATMPQCLYCPAPPRQSHKKKGCTSGSVLLSVLVSADGHTEKVKVLKSVRQDCDELAVKAVKEWRFKPSVAPDGENVEYTTPVEITFAP
jgi:TonB family protein